LIWIGFLVIFLDKTGKIALYKAIEADDEKLISTLKNKLMRQKIVAGNWKMHKNAEETEDF
jgi:hypothetical protein